MLDLSPKLTKIPFSIISISTLVRYIKNIADKTEFCKVAIIGSQGTGKTNIAMDVAQNFERLTRESCLVVYARGQNIIEMLIEPDLLREILSAYISDKKYMLFILDDFSYTLDLDRQKKKIVLHSYTKLRHVFPTKKLITIMTIHYKKSVVPLLRDVYFTIYTHMTPEMLNDFRDNYKLNVYARNYMRYMRNFYLENKGFLLNTVYNVDEFELKQVANDIHIVEKINLTNDKQQQQTKHNANILIRSAKERLGLIVSWSDTEYLYYRILYDENGRFNLNTTDIVVISNNDERINVDKSRIIDISRYIDAEEVEKDKSRRVAISDITNNDLANIEDGEDDISADIIEGIEEIKEKGEEEGQEEREGEEELEDSKSDIGDIIPSVSIGYPYRRRRVDMAQILASYNKDEPSPERIKINLRLKSGEGEEEKAR